MLPSIFGEPLFDEFLCEPFAEERPREDRDPLYGKHAKNLMKTDVKDLENAYEVAVDLPGFKKEEIHLDLRDGYLTIRAEKSLDRENRDEDGHYLRRERYVGSCSRSFYVGEMKPEDVKAHFEDGILKLTVPKADTPNPAERTTIVIE